MDNKIIGYIDDNTEIDEYIDVELEVTFEKLQKLLFELKEDDIETFNNLINSLKEKIIDTDKNNGIKNKIIGYIDNNTLINEYVDVELEVTFKKLQELLFELIDDDIEAFNDLINSTKDFINIDIIDIDIFKDIKINSVYDELKIKILLKAFNKYSLEDIEKKLGISYI